jgi:hypothetical protein
LGVLFAIYKLVLFENRVMRIMFELKTEELGRKGCILWSFIIYTACQILEYQRRVAKWVRNVAWIGVKVILNRILIRKREGKSAFRRPVSIREDNIEMDFKELYQDGF